jgi:hypothetical protein
MFFFSNENTESHANKEFCQSDDEQVKNLLSTMKKICATILKHDNVYEKLKVTRRMLNI